MTVNDMLIGALKPLAPTEPDVYTGNKRMYFTFNYDTVPLDIGDDEPAHERYLVQVHLFCPIKHDSVELRRQAKRRLLTAGFTWPDEFNANSDRVDEGEMGYQHYVFECETVREV